MFFHRVAKIHAPEFPPGMTWLNGSPVTMRALAGKPVLIDFWTYSCINCQHTLPHLKAWHERYAKLGLTIIGVHTPEFAFEKDEKNVLKAIKEAGIPYPVVLDNEYALWHLYANRAWPHSYLVNKDGVIVYDHVGEGGYAETEMAIQKALQDSGVKKLPDVAEYANNSGAACYRTTPETYLGYLRGRYGNEEEFLPDAEEAFTERGERQDDVPYLHGHWKICSEYVEHVKMVAAPTEYIQVKYSAFGVNVVMSADSRATIVVELDGLPLSDDMQGADITRGKGGSSVVTVHGARMYRLVKAATYHRGTLTLRVRDAGVRLYAFTFEGCA